MASEWFYSHDGERHGPVPVEQIKEMAANRQLRPDDLVWQSGMETWTQAGKVPGLLPPASVPPPILGGSPAAPIVQAVGDSAAIKEAASNKIAAGICGILIGSLGVHKFIIGLTTPGLIMLLVTLLTCGFGGIVMHAIGLVEGIIYLTKSDEDFYQTYIVEKKGWF
jgi:TM2 domain-containing membrane protein YozV